MRLFSPPRYAIGLVDISVDKWKIFVISTYFVFDWDGMDTIFS